ncbi:MAG: response regulator [Chitinophagales bacterium]|nr:response regulator [Chitinophagales bacterium]
MIRAIIVDDETPCLETLRLMIEKKFSDVMKVIAVCNNPKNAIETIDTEKPDVLFLDVEMPGMSGIELLQCLKHTNMCVVFTTAHQHYAIQAIKLNALDYLTKPISLQELTIAIQKCVIKKSSSNNVNNVENFIQHLKGTNTKKIAISTASATQFVPIQDIIRIESNSNYSTIYFTNRPKQTVVKTLKDFEQQLLQHNFLRIHHSHLVNAEHIIGIKNQDNGYIIMQNNDLIEISRRKKQEVLQKLKDV